MNRLTGKAALITGGGGGIGFACGRIFCAQGAAVTLVDASAEALDRTVTALAEAVPGARVTTLVADVADAEQATETVNQAVAAHGRLDILVNNAAMRNYATLSEATPAEWQAIVGVNLVGAASYCKAALPALRASGKGSIVNVS